MVGTKWLNLCLFLTNALIGIHIGGWLRQIGRREGGLGRLGGEKVAAVQREFGIIYFLKLRLKGKCSF